MKDSNKSHLIAGFFRYHREQLNYSLRGLVESTDVVDLSSLSAFENGKKTLSEKQLVALFQMIGYDYHEVMDVYDFSNEYVTIVDFICMGEIYKAELLLTECKSKGVNNTIGLLNFSLLHYCIDMIRNRDSEYSMFINQSKSLFTSDQQSIYRISVSVDLRHKNEYHSAIEVLKEAEQYTYNPKVRAWICLQFGIYFILAGNYAEATISLLEAKQRYGDFLGVINMIQANLNLGNAYSLTSSYGKAEEVLRDAYYCALSLKKTTKLLAKSFDSLCWLYIITGQYDKVIELIKDIPVELIETSNTYFILSWGNYKNGNYETAKQYAIQGQIRFKDEEFVCLIYKYIENAVTGKKTGQETLLKKAISMLDPEHNKETDELLTRELMDLYERRGNYEKAYKTAKKLLNR